MNSIRFARLLLVGLVILLTLMPVGGAWAKPPERETWHFEADWLFIECGDFEVWEHLVMDVRVAHFYDGDGNWTRTQEHWTADGYVYNLNDPNLWLPEKTVHNMAIYYESGESTMVGPLVNVTLPGGGSIFHAVGRLVYDSEGNLTFYAGHNDWIDGNTDALCAALGGP